MSRLNTVLNALLKSIIAPFVVLLLAPLAASLYSRLSTGSWTNVIRRAPLGLWVGAGVVLLVWIALAILNARQRRRSSPAIAVVSMPRGSILGWQKIGELSYHDVMWVIRGPRQLSPIQADDLNVETPPRCPECKTGLEEVQRPFGRYSWRCVRCSFRRGSKDSFYRQADRVLRIAQSDWEKQNPQSW